MMLGRSAGQVYIKTELSESIDHTFKISTKRIAIPTRLAR